MAQYPFVDLDLLGHKFEEGLVPLENFLWPATKFFGENQQDGVGLNSRNRG